MLLTKDRQACIDCGVVSPCEDENDTPMGWVELTESDGCGSGASGYTLCAACANVWISRERREAIWPGQHR